MEKSVPYNWETRTLRLKPNTGIPELWFGDWSHLRLPGSAMATVLGFTVHKAPTHLHVLRLSQAKQPVSLVPPVQLESS